MSSKNTIKYSFLSVLIFFITACSSDNNQGKGESVSLNEKQRIKINTKVNTGLLALDTLLNAKTARLIPLETNDSSIFAAANRFNITDKGILVADFSYNKIILFDNNGKYIKLISKLGKGPDEHLSIFDLRYNPLNGTVDLHDKSWKFFQYDIETGKMLNSRPFISPDFNTTYFYPLNGTSYLLYNYFMDDNIHKKYRVAYLKEGKVLWEKFKYSELKNRKDFLMNGTLFYTYKDSVRFFERFIPVIYNVTEKGLDPMFYFDFGNDKSGVFNLNDTDHYIEKNKKDVDDVWLSEIYESNKYLFIEFGVSHDQSRAYSIVEKSTRKMLCFAYGGHHFSGLTIYVEEVKDNQLHAVIAASDLVKKQEELAHKSPGSLTEFEKQINSLHIKADDNDIVFTCSFKN